jgi:hypothetical protein
MIWFQTPANECDNNLKDDLRFEPVLDVKIGKSACSNNSFEAI